MQLVLDRARGTYSPFAKRYGTHGWPVYDGVAARIAPIRSHGRPAPITSPRNPVAISWIRTCSWATRNGCPDRTPRCHDQLPRRPSGRSVLEHLAMSWSHLGFVHLRAGPWLIRGERLHGDVAGHRGDAGQAGQLVGVEVLVGGQVGDLDLEQVVVVAGDVVAVQTTSGSRMTARSNATTSARACRISRTPANTRRPRPTAAGSTSAR